MAEAWGGEAGGEGWSDGEGRRRQTLDPIIPPQPLVKTASRKLVKAVPTVTGALKLRPGKLEGA